MADSTGRNALTSCIQRVEVVGGMLDTPDFEPQCFTDDSNTIFFGIWELVDGAIILNFYTIDAGGNLTPYNPTSAPVPCDPNDVESSSTCWVATADGAGYSTGDRLTQWFFWDVTTVPPTLTGTAWYNDTTGLAIAAAVPGTDRDSCEPTPFQIVPGHIDHCILEDVTTELDAEGTFGEANPIISTLVTDPITEGIIRAAVERALEAEQEEIAKGILVTTFRITTENATVFEFPPSAVIRNVVNGSINLTTADVVSWPQPLTDNIVLLEYAVLTDCICQQVEMVQRVNADNTVTLLGVYNPRIIDVDGNKEQIALPLPIGDLGPFPGDCQPVDKDRLPPTVGYLRECTPFDITLPINVDASFSDNLAATSTLQTTVATATLLVDAIGDALEYENEEIANGISVTNFIIRTDDGSVFEFPPSAFESATATTLTFTTASLVAWPGPLNDTISQIEYSKFDGCECFSVEMVQEYDEDSNTLRLLGIFRPSVRDNNGNKERIELPLTFGTTGPFPGPCPGDEQVLSIEPLCCDDDLLANNPDIANQRLAWLDGSDAALMLDAVGGVPIAGNDGDQVFEVQDKIDPGVALSFVIPTAAAPGDDPPINPPTLLNNAVNGLPVLQFDAANRERLRLDTNTAPGADWTLFYLFRAEISGVSNQSILSVGPNNGDGGAYASDIGSWQFSRDSLENWFVWRSQVSDTDAAPTIIFQNNPGPDDGLSPPVLGSANYDAGLGPLAEAYDGQIHLLTANFDSATNILNVFFDGQLRLTLDYTPAPDGAANLAADYFRIFGNRNGDSFGTGDIAEIFFADAVLNADETSTVNAYLICKWGIDPSLAAGGAGDLTLAPAGTYDSPTPLVRITRADGDIVFRNTDTGLEFPVPPVPGLSVCAVSGGDGCCTQPNLESEDVRLTAGGNLTVTGNTANSVSVYVETGTADVNGAQYSAGAIRNFNGDDGQNNIANDQVIDNVTGNVNVLIGRYV